MSSTTPIFTDRSAGGTYSSLGAMHSQPPLFNSAADDDTEHGGDLHEQALEPQPFVWWQFLVSGFAVGVALTAAIAVGVFLAVYAPGESSSSTEAPNTFLELVRPSLDECSGSGLIYPDSSACECFECFKGKTCATLDTECIVDVGVGNAAIFYSFYEQYWGGGASIAVPAWYRPSYGMPQVVPPFAIGLGAALADAIRELHANVGNAVTDGYSIVYADGATQVIRALLYAIAQVDGEAKPLYARPPFYPAFRGWGNENPIIASWTDETDLNTTAVTEIVTHPSNPVGDYPPPVYPDAQRVIYDLVYYWPHSVEITTMYNESIMVFSLSKMTGHSSTRFGWALVRDEDIAYKTIGFLHGETFGNSAPGSYQALSIIRDLNAQLTGTAPSEYEPPKGESLFSVTQEKLSDRWDTILDVFEGQQNFVLSSERNTFYGWVQCNVSSVLSGNMTCEEAFLAYKIQGNYGNGEMGVDGYIRLNFVTRDSTFDILEQRLTEMFKDYSDRFEEHLGNSERLGGLSNQAVKRRTHDQGKETGA